jgi:hypothetical protein
MEQLMEILTSLSSIIGVPAVLCLAWAAFVIRDHAKRIQKLEDAMDENNDKRKDELNQLYNKINTISNDLSYIKGIISERYGKDTSAC